MTHNNRSEQDVYDSEYFGVPTNVTTGKGSNGTRPRALMEENKRTQQLNTSGSSRQQNSFNSHLKHPLIQSK
jgi:hypothetical protein